MTKIKNIVARQIFDSRGNPTVETDVITSNGVLGRAAVPSGASTGEHEAVELRDESEDFMGKSVYRAVKNVNESIFKELKNLSVFDQELIDSKMIELDNTANKSKLGANAILSVSLAVAKAAASIKSRIQGWVCRRVLMELKAEHEQQLERSKAATRLQSVMSLQHRTHGNVH